MRRFLLLCPTSLLALCLGSAPVATADLGSWMLQTTSTTVPRTNHALAAARGHLYVIGGGDNPGTGFTPAFASVEFASMGPDGVVGPWSVTTSLLTPRYNVSAVGVGDRIYVVGGWSATGCCGSTIHYASTEIGVVSPDGTIAEWVTGSSLVEGAGHGALVTDGAHLYHVGGFGDLGITATVQAADLLPDGSLSPWRLMTPLPGGREGPAAAVAAGRLYVFGGYAGPILDTVVSAPILPNGDLGPWRGETTLTTPRYHAVAFAGRSRVFVGGGTFGNACLDQHASFEEAVLGADGLLGPWVPSAPLNLPRYGHAATLSGGTAIVAAGTSGNCAPQATTETVACLDCAQCGDGVRDPGEDCDDGNLVDGDCCSATCKFETGACDDGIFCNGADKCSAGVCVHAGDPCTPGPECSRSCSEAGTCFAPTLTPCSDDGNACTDDVCDGAGNCGVNSTASCDDGDACTTEDRCAGGACVGGPPLTCAPCFGCDPHDGCVPRLATGCRATTTSGSALLVLKNSVAGRQKDALLWKWLRSSLTTKADFGDPVAPGGTDYQLCVYDRSDTAPRVVLGAGMVAEGACAGKPCWKETGTGFSYLDPDLTPDGIGAVQLKEGLTGHAKIIVKGKGPNLGMSSPLIITQPVTAQMTNSEGVCWEATYSAPAMRNQADQFMDKSD